MLVIDCKYDTCRLDSITVTLYYDTTPHDVDKLFTQHIRAYLNEDSMTSLFYDTHSTVESCHDLISIRAFERFNQNKEYGLHKNTVLFPMDWFGTPIQGVPKNPKTIEITYC